MIDRDGIDDGSIEERGRGRFGRTRRAPRGLPLRAVAPNAVTALALCSGLSGVRFAIGGQWESAVAMIMVAGVLDGRRTQTLTALVVREQCGDRSTQALGHDRGRAVVGDEQARPVGLGRSPVARDVSGDARRGAGPALGQRPTPTLRV